MSIFYLTLIKEFDKIDVSEGLQEDAVDNPTPRAINLLIDTTFFGREYGFLVFHDCTKAIYFKEIKTESIQEFREGLIAVRDCGYYIFYSVTVDGRRGVTSIIFESF